MGIAITRRLGPAIILVAGLIALALSCGGSEEAPAAASVAQTVAESSVAADAAAPHLMAGDASAGAPMSAAATMAPVASAQAAPAPEPAAPPPEQASPASDDGSSNTGQLPAQSGRQLIVEGRLRLEVDDIDGAVRQLETLAGQLGGWVESAEVAGDGGFRSAFVNVRVPADRFDDAMQTLRGLGHVTVEGVSSEDVTDRLIDNDARLEAWTVQEKRLVVLLENAATVEDVIDIERRISEVRADIERLAATQRSLQNRVSASLIRVSLHLPQRFAAEPPSGSLTLAVGDPRATADTIASRVAGLNGFIGEKTERQEDRRQVVDLVAYVRPRDLAGLMDYAVTLGEPSHRRLDSVGPSPAGETPDARLSLSIRSNVDSAASLSLGATEPLEVANQLRALAESAGGYVESWNEQRYDEGEHESIQMELVVRAADLRELMDAGAALGKADNWQFSAVGQSPTDATPNARLTVSVYTHQGLDAQFWWIVGLSAAGGAVLIAFSIVATQRVWRRRQRRGDSLPAAGDPSTGSG